MSSNRCTPRSSAARELSLELLSAFGMPDELCGSGQPAALQFLQRPHTLKKRCRWSGLRLVNPRCQRAVYELKVCRTDLPSRSMSLCIICTVVVQNLQIPEIQVGSLS